MIDTLRLQFDEFMITDELSKELNVNTMKKNGKEIAIKLFKTESGIIYGKKAHHNWKGISFDVNTKYRNGIDCAMPKGSIILSLPKFFGKKYTSNLDQDEIISAINKLQHELNEVGIITNIWAAKLVVLHLFVDFPLESEFRDYLPIFLQFEDFRLIQKKDFQLPYTLEMVQVSYVFTAKEMNIIGRIIVSVQVMK